MTVYLPSFLLGLAGTLHCIGMCSPLAMSVSRAGKGTGIRTVLYNSGRIITYGILGGLFSFAGRMLAIGGIQEWVSIGVGVAAVALGLARVQLTAPKFLLAAAYRATNSLKDRFRTILNHGSSTGVTLLGMINGILPCGMTFVALGYCITLGSPMDGFMAMVFFGLGTLPAMIGFASVVQLAVRKLKLGYKTIQVSLLIIAGVLLITRGITDFNHETHQNTDAEITVCPPE